MLVLKSPHRRCDKFFVGFQFVIIAGLVSGYDKIKIEPKIGILFLILGLLFSVFTLLVLRRSLLIIMAIIKSIDEIEENYQEFILIKTYRTHTKSAFGVIIKLCLVMSMILILFWLSFIYLFINTI